MRLLLDLHLADDNYDPPITWDWRTLLDLGPDDRVTVTEVPDTADFPPSRPTEIVQSDVSFVEFTKASGLDRESYEAKIAYQDFTTQPVRFAEWWAAHQGEYA